MSRFSSSAGIKKFSSNEDLQHDSTKLRRVETQLKLLPERFEPTSITDAVIYSQPNRLAAFRLAQMAAGKDDKEIYGPLGIDKGTWSRIQTGDAHFPINKQLQYQQLCGNHVLLKYDAYHSGFELVPMRSDLERRVAELEQELVQERHDRDIEREYAKRMMGGGS